MQLLTLSRRARLRQARKRGGADGGDPGELKWSADDFVGLMTDAEPMTDFEYDTFLKTMLQMHAANDAARIADLALRLAEQRGGFGADDGVKKKRLRRPSSSTVGDAVY